MLHRNHSQWRSSRLLRNSSRFSVCFFFDVVDDDYITSVSINKFFTPLVNLHMLKVTRFKFLPGILGRFCEVQSSASARWCHRSKGFCVLASLLQRRRSTEANQTLHGVWPSRGLLHYIYIFGGSCSITEFCQVQNSLCIQVLRSPILAALLHGTQVVGVSQTVAFSRECNLYLAWRPSHWALTTF